MPKEDMYFWGKSAAEKRARTSHAVVVVVTSGLRKAEPWALQRGVGPKQPAATVMARCKERRTPPILRLRPSLLTNILRKRAPPLLQRKKETPSYTLLALAF